MAVLESVYDSIFINLVKTDLGSNTWYTETAQGGLEVASVEFSSGQFQSANSTFIYPYLRIQKIGRILKLESARLRRGKSGRALGHALPTQLRSRRKGVPRRLGHNQRSPEAAGPLLIS